MNLALSVIDVQKEFFKFSPTAAQSLIKALMFLPLRFTPPNEPVENTS